MKLHEIVDSLIELSTEEMPEEARKSLDDAIDNIVSSMTELQLQNIVEESFGKMVGEEEEIQAIKSMMEGNIAIA
tara:strand:- start:182 stop:406 length:225 start_codon:yes stop_codon:yes gene_type:complete